MKRVKITYYTIFFPFLLLQSCFSSSSNNNNKQQPDPDPSPVVIEYRPIMKTRTQIQNSIKKESTHVLNNPSRIFYFQQYIFIVEKNKGIHILNNQNPESPIKEAFIIIPGCQELSIQNNYLYIDSAVDLMTFRLSDITNSSIGQKIVPLNIQKNVCSIITPPNSTFVRGEDLPSDENTLIIDWEIKG